MGVFGPDATGYGTFLWHNLIPVTIGNLIGGVAIAVSYWYIYLVEALEKNPSVELKELETGQSAKL
jgi:formate/nitrite transporter FocA (FNT family)